MQRNIFPKTLCILPCTLVVFKHLLFQISRAFPNISIINRFYRGFQNSDGYETRRSKNFLVIIRILPRGHALYQLFKVVYDANEDIHTVLNTVDHRKVEGSMLEAVKI